MAGLNVPKMDGTDGGVARCCQGANKNKLYPLKNPCPDGLKLDLSNGECACVECSGDSENPNGSCQRLGYSSCYVCEEGKCVPGPFCCSNLPGKLFYGCGETKDDIDPDRDCCVNFMEYYKFSSGPWTTVAGSYDEEKKRRYCNEYPQGVDQRRFYSSKYDCEEWLVQSETVEGTSRAEKVTCGGPKGKYSYSKVKLFRKSPSGSTIPARAFCTGYGIGNNIQQVYGPQQGNDFGGGCYWYWCNSGIAQWKIGVVVAASSRTYIQFRKEQRSYRQTKIEGCAHPDRPDGGGGKVCACTGQDYAQQEEYGNWSGACGICSGKASWNGLCYGTQPV